MKLLSFLLAFLLMSCNETSTANEEFQISAESIYVQRRDFRDTVSYQNFSDFYVDNDSLFFFLTAVRFGGCPEGKYFSFRDNDTLVVEVYARDNCEMFTYESSFFYGLFNRDNFDAVKVINLSIDTVGTTYLLDTVSLHSTLDSILEDFTATDNLFNEQIRSQQ